MFSRISLGYKRCSKVCSKTLSCIRLYSTNDGSMDNKFIDDFIKTRQDKVKNFREKLEKSNVIFTKILSDRMSNAEKNNVFIKFSSYLDENIIEDDLFNEDLALEVVRSSVSPSVAEHFGVGVGPDSFFKAVGYAIIFAPFIPERGIWFSSDTKR